MRSFFLFLLCALRVQVAHAQSFLNNKTIYASEMTGADAGAQINAADAVLGTTCGTIMVTSGLATLTVSTPVTLSLCHTLSLKVALTWAAKITLSGNNLITSSGSVALQTFSFTGAWMSGTSVSNAEINNIYGTFSTPLGGDFGNTLLTCSGCTNVRVHDNHTIRGGTIKTTSVTDTYSTTTAANMSNYVWAYNNFVDGITGPCIGSGSPVLNCPSPQSLGNYADYFRFTNHVYVANEQIQNVNLALFGFGGTNNIDCTDSIFPNCANLATDFHIDSVTATNTQAAQVFSMVDQVLSQGANARQCVDICLDFEGSTNWRMTNFYATGGVNAELAVYFHNKKGSFVGGTVVHTQAASGSTPSYSAWTINGGNDSTKSQDIVFNNVFFDCTLTSADCLIQFDPATATSLTNSPKILNTRVSNHAGTNEQGDVLIRGNYFLQNTSFGTANNMLDLSTANLARRVVDANTFVTTVSQPASSAAIFASDDYNNQSEGFVSPTLLIRNNVTSNNWPYDVLVAILGNSTGVVPPAVLSFGNVFGSGSVAGSPGSVAAYFGLAEQQNVSVASASTLPLFNVDSTSPVRISGTSTIETITVPPTLPYTGKSCFTALATGAWSWGNTGNILTTAGSAGVNNSYQICYNGVGWTIK